MHILSTHNHPQSTHQASSLFRTIGTRHLGISIRLRRKLLVALGRSLDGAVSRVPVRRADLAVFIRELERVDEAEGLVDGAADGEVVDRDLHMPS